jgi:hypothetical protein
MRNGYPCPQCYQWFTCWAFHDRLRAAAALWLRGYFALLDAVCNPHAEREANYDLRREEAIK